MYPRSSRFDTAVLTGAATTITKAIAWSGQTWQLLSFEAGSVTIDNRNHARRTATLTIVSPDASLVPHAPTDLLSPFNTYLQLWRGVDYADGSTASVPVCPYAPGAVSASSTVVTPGQELIPLGVYLLTKTSTVTDSTGITTITLTLQDLTAKVGLFPLRDVVVLPTNQVAQTLGPQIQYLLGQAWSGAQFALDPGPAYSDTVVAGIDFARVDAWAIAVDICDRFGYDLYFDNLGYVKIKPYNPALNPDATYADGQVLVTANRDLDAANSANGVIYEATGTNMLIPYKGQAWDIDAASPTKVTTDTGLQNGNPTTSAYGINPYRATGPANSQADADARAAAMLPKYLGVTEGAAWTQIVNPAHDAWDCVSVQQTATGIASASGQPLLLILDGVTIPLNYDQTMSATARARRWGVTRS